MKQKPKFTIKLLEAPYRIQIISNTYWELGVDGNIVLSQMHGSGKTDVMITAPADMPFISGSVFFQYGGIYCSELQPLDITVPNPLYFRVNLSSVQLHGKNDIAELTVNSNTDIVVGNIDDNLFSVLQYDDKIIIVSNTDNEFGCNNDVFITISSVNNPSVNNVYITQCTSKNTSADDNMVLFATYQKITDTSFIINVKSIYNENIIPFTWDNIPGVTINQISNYNLMLYINGVVGRNITLRLHNKYTNFDLDISTISNKPNNTQFSVIPNGSTSFGADGGTIQFLITSKEGNAD